MQSLSQPTKSIGVYMAKVTEVSASHLHPHNRVEASVQRVTTASLRMQHESRTTLIQVRIQPENVLPDETCL